MICPKSLTPQMVDRFKSRFGDRVAVLHSGLVSKNTMNGRLRIRKRTLVGARSSVFAPLAIRMWPQDERHGATYDLVSKDITLAMAIWREGVPSVQWCWKCS